MTTQYTSILKLALPVQGELSGTWGDVVNDNITSMVEEAVAGRAVINTWTTNSHTLTTADGTTAESRCAMLEFTDTGTALTGAATVVCPSASKLYVCKNDAGQQVTIKTSAGTGVAIPDGQTMFVFCDGTNVEQCTTNFNSLSFNDYTLSFGGAVTTAGAFTTSGAYALTLTTTAATNVTLPTTGTLATLAGTETLTNKTLTAPTISSPTLTGSISATDLTISGDTTIGDAAADGLTVNATITSDLIFTDNTYDIGASGATRPRNLFLAGNATIGGTVTLSGGIDVTGALGVDGDFDVNTDKFTVASASGNTAVAGTLGVTGVTTATGGLNVDTINEITAAGGVTIDSVLLKDGDITGTIGGSTASAGSFTTLTASGDLAVDTDALFVDVSANRVGVNNTANRSTNAFGNGTMQIESAAYAALQLFGNPNSADGSFIGLWKSRGGAVGGVTIVQDGDTLGGIYSGGFDGTNAINGSYIQSQVDGTPGTNDMPTRLMFGTTADGSASPSERLRINSTGVVDIKGAGTAAAPSIILAGDSDTGWYRPSANHIGFVTQGSAALVIDSTQRILAGTDTGRATYGNGKARIQIEGTGTDTAGMSITRTTDDTGAASFAFAKTRSTASAILSDGDPLGTLTWQGADGTDLVSQAAQIQAVVDGTPGANDMPGRLVFSTTADGAASATQRVQIDSTGQTTFSYPVAITDNDSLGLGAATPAEFGSGVPTIAFQGTADNGRAGALNFREYAASGDGAITAQIYSTDGDDNYGFVLNAQQGLLKLNTGGLTNTALAVDQSQRVLIGGTTSNTISGYQNSLQMQGTLADDAGISIARYANSTAAGVFTFGKTRSTTVGTVGTSVASGDALGYIMWAGDDGTDIVTNAAWVIGEVDGTPGSNDMPGRLVFSTTPDGAASPTERLRITSTGALGVNNGGTQTSHTFYDFKATATNLGEFRINEMGRVPEFQDAQSATTYWYKVYERHYQTPNGFAHGAQIMEFLGTGSTAGNVHWSKITVNTKQQQASDLFEIFVEGNGGYNCAAKFDASGGANSNGLLEIWIQPQENYVATGMWTKTYLSRNGTSGGGGEFQLTNTNSATQPSGSTIMYNSVVSGQLSYKDGSGTVNESFATSVNDTYKSYFGNLDVGRRLGLGQLGTTWPTIEGSDNQIMQVSAPSNRAAINIFQSESGSQGGRLRFAKGRSNSTNGIGTAAQNGDQLGIILAMADDGTDLAHYAAYINFTADNTVGTNDVPGAIQFATTLDGNSASSVRMTIDNQGKVLRYAGAQKVQKYAQASHSAGTASSTLVSNLSTDLLTSTYTFAKVYMHGNENAATNASAREYILLKRTGGFEISEQGSGITYGNTNGHYALSISGNSLVATRTGTGGTGTCFVVFDVFYR